MNAAAKLRARERVLLALAVMLMFVLGAALAPRSMAQVEPYSEATPKGQPSIMEPPARNPENAPGLPFTGADLALFVATGLAAIATGTVIVRGTRTRRRSR